jgi:prepilin-type N-terminal cleavage/methylation domain-containing protein
VGSTVPGLPVSARGSWSPGDGLQDSLRDPRRHRRPTPVWPEAPVGAGLCYVLWMRAPLRRTAGYTIIELLLVMIIIAVIAGITYVRMGPALDRARVRGATGMFAGDLQYAQVLAARQRSPILFTVNSSTLTYQITDRGGTVFRTRDLGPSGNYNLSELTATPTTLEVFPNAIAAQSATYTIGAPGTRRQVTFSRAGQIRVTTIP